MELLYLPISYQEVKRMNHHAKIWTVTKHINVTCIVVKSGSLRMPENHRSFRVKISEQSLAL